MYMMVYDVPLLFSTIFQFQRQLLNANIDKCQKNEIYFLNNRLIKLTELLYTVKKILKIRTQKHLL